MAALAPTLPIPRLAAKRDEELVARVRRGDEGAFAELHDRHRAALVRYARRILGDRLGGTSSEDVVQEVFVKAHAALRADDRPMKLRAWLHRLVRNRCLDELRRAGNATSLPIDEALDAPAGASAGAAHAGDPYDVVNRRHALRHMLEDIATLPDRQREVLLRREVDGATHEQVAADLGITVRASKNLANRARENLARRADARGAACATVRDDLLSAHERRRRASAHAHRHLATCRDCRRFRAQLGTVRSALRILSPGPALAPLATLLGGWAALGGAGAGAGLKLAAAGAVTAALAGGAVEFSEQVALPGERAPFTVRSAIFTGGWQAGGGHVPRGTAIVTRKLTLAPGREHASVTLPCPAGTRVAGLATPAAAGDGARVGYGYSPGTLVGSSTTARIVFEDRRVRRPAPVTVGTLCKRPDAAGSLLAAPAFAAAKRVHRVCADRAYLFETPDEYVVGTVFRDQPVVVKKRDKSRKWVRVVTDAGVRGWLRASVVSKGQRCPKKI